MITLSIDASTYIGDVAVLDDANVLAEESTPMKDAVHERLMPAVAAALARAGVRVTDVDRIVCGGGPGSFTSLRIAGAIAKGIATGINRPLFAVPSMALVVGGASLKAGTYLVAVDALRGEFYVGLYDVAMDSDRRAIVEREPARLVAAGAVGALAAEFGARIVGLSAAPGSIEALPRARAVALLSAGDVRRVDVGAWEPAYGRLAEAQVKWEKAHGRPLAVG